MEKGCSVNLPRRNYVQRNFPGEFNSTGMGTATWEIYLDYVFIYDKTLGPTVVPSRLQIPPGSSPVTTEQKSRCQVLLSMSGQSGKNAP